MKFLLDTHIFLCWTGQPGKLSSETIATMSDPAVELFLSTASTWEITIKASLGRLELREPLRAIVERETTRNGLRLLPITFEHTQEVASLPQLHRDPFDRILIAQAVVEGAELVTGDAAVGAYSDAPVRLVS